MQRASAEVRRSESFVLEIRGVQLAHLRHSRSVTVDERGECGEADQVHHHGVDAIDIVIVLDRHTGRRDLHDRPMGAGVASSGVGVSSGVAACFAVMGWAFGVYR